MARVDEDDVKAICDVQDGVDLTPYITSANELVTELCSNSDYTDTRLALIERWLSAHFYCIFDPQASTEMAGAVQATYEGRTGTGLKFTRYGQQAMLLDTAGNLAVLSNSLDKATKTVEAQSRAKSITWLGKTS